MSQRQANSKLLWTYFKKIAGTDRKAICTLCSEIYSYYSTTGNLKTHLKNKHFSTYVKFGGTQPFNGKNTWEPLIYNL